MKKFHHWLDWLTPRRRRTGQGVVEFGLIVVGVAIVGIAGLTVLGRAEEGYFIPLAQTLAAPAPTGSEDVVHPTDVVIVSCPPASATATVPTTITCTFTVRDTGGAPRTWPDGSVHLMFGATDLGSCTLGQDFGPPADTARSTCTASIGWTFGPADVNPPQPRKLAAHYIPTDGKHHAPAMDPFTTISIHQPLTLALSCVNPWAVAVEPGHPVWDPLESTCRHASLSIL